jgi:hypothetical protein
VEVVKTLKDISLLNINNAKSYAEKVNSYLIELSVMTVIQSQMMAVMRIAKLNTFGRVVRMRLGKVSAKM